MSIAYLDPGNIESDLQSGSQAQYRVTSFLFENFFLKWYSSSGKKNKNLVCNNKILYLLSKYLFVKWNQNNDNEISPPIC